MYMEIYVHPSLGDDNGFGTQLRPYLTVHKAVDEVKKISGNMSDGEECKINIMLGCGVNRVESAIEIDGLKDGIVLHFRPWDDMYTTLSCARRINSFDFKYDADNGFYSYTADSGIGYLYVNGNPVKRVESGSALLPGTSCVLGNTVYYLPEKNEEIKYCVTELSGSNSIFKIKNCFGVIFENIEFTAMGDSGEPFVAAESCGNVFLKTCRFKNSASDAIGIIGCLSGISIIDCEFHNIDAGCISVSGAEDVDISNNYFHLCNSPCLRVDGESRISAFGNTFSLSQAPLGVLNNKSALRFESNRIECAIPNRCLVEYDKSSELLAFDCLLVKGSASESENKYLLSDDCPNEYDESEFLGLLDFSPEVREKICNLGYRKKIRNYGDVI